jgi:hypothetical protein
MRATKQRERSEEALESLRMQPGPDIDRYSFELGFRAAEDKASEGER